MKKIYSKFVKDRKKEFQIETALWNDEGKRKVSKRKLYSEGQAHIDTIVETYQMYADSDLVCRLEQIDDKIFFEYIDGITFERQLMDALKEADKTKVQELIDQYNKIVDAICAWNKDDTKLSGKDFSSVFGQSVYDVECESNIIFDLTFDNLIFDGEKHKVIDYEWRFDFPLEKEFVKFRAVYAFVMKCKGLIEALYSIEEFYALFFVSLDNKDRYLKYNNNFIKYVYGAHGYNDVIKKYEKRSIDVFNEESVNALRVLHNRKVTNEESCEDMFFNKLLNTIENNKEYYDDYSKFYKVTKKVKEQTPNGYTESKAFVEEFSAYIDDVYGMLKYYKDDVREYYTNELERLNKIKLEKEAQIVEKENIIGVKERAIEEREDVIRVKDAELAQARFNIEKLTGDVEYMKAEAAALREALESTMEWKVKHKLSSIKSKIVK